MVFKLRHNEHLYLLTFSWIILITKMCMTISKLKKKFLLICINIFYQLFVITSYWQIIFSIRVLMYREN